MADTDLIQVAQLPIIIQHLEAKSAEIREKTQQAMALAVSPETLADVRKVRSDLNKDRNDLEDSRKAVKKAIMAPYEEFEAYYRKYITIPFQEADKDLGSKIWEVEQGIIGACTQEMKAFAAELIQAEHLSDWLTWDRLEVRINLTEAKQKTHKKLRESIACKVTNIGNDVTAIADHEDAEEIMAEYKQCLNLGQAMGIVQDRHKRIAQERERKVEWQVQKAAEAEAAAKVEAAAAPVSAPIPAPAAAPADPGKVYQCRFTVHATKDQLRKLKDFLKSEGIRYE